MTSVNPKTLSENIAQNKQLVENMPNSKFLCEKQNSNLVLYRAQITSTSEVIKRKEKENSTHWEDNLNCEPQNYEQSNWTMQFC